MLVAQCTGATSAPCDLPTGLPWYFGLVIAVVWIAVVIGAVAVGRRLIQTRRSRRRGDDDGPRQLGRASGTDVERW